MTNTTHEHQHRGHGSHDHGSHDHGSHDHDSVDWDAMGESLEEEGTVIAPMLEEILGWVDTIVGDDGRAPRRILDVGSGPGVGTVSMLQRWPDAEAVAVDAGQELLARADRRAADRGVADRMTTIERHLPTDLTDLGRFDLIWVSMVLHHLGDGTEAVRTLADLLEPGGVLVAVDFGDPMTFLPEDLDLGRPGLDLRLEEAVGRWLRHGHGHDEVPDDATVNGDVDALVRAAGLEVVAVRDFRLRLESPLDVPSRRLLAGHLRRLQTVLADDLDPDDVAALETLLDDTHADGVHHSDRVHLDTSRRVHVIAAPTA